MFGWCKDSYWLRTEARLVQRLHFAAWTPQSQIRVDRSPMEQSYGSRSKDDASATWQGLKLALESLAFKSRLHETDLTRCPRLQELLLTFDDTHQSNTPANG